MFFNFSLIIMNVCMCSCSNCSIEYVECIYINLFRYTTLQINSTHKIILFIHLDSTAKLSNNQLYEKLLCCLQYFLYVVSM